MVKTTTAKAAKARLASGLALALVMATAVTRASAGPPPQLPPNEGQPADDFPEPPVGDYVAEYEDPSGFWLSVELIGPRGAQIDAAQALVTDSVEADLPRGGQPLTGEPVGRVETLDAALRWVDRHAFGVMEVEAQQTSSEAPGGPLYANYGVVMTALVITGATPNGGTRAFPWPSSDQTAIPPGLKWRSAELTVGRTPLFAAPSPSLPPASERYLSITGDRAMWLMGEAVERCDARGVDCLRWVRVLSRDGDRFQAGWLPAYLVVAHEDWIHDPLGGRRFMVQGAHRESGSAGYVLIERQGAEPGSRRTGLRIAHAGAQWPAVTVAILAGNLSVHIAGQLMVRQVLDEAASMVETP